MPEGLDGFLGPVGAVGTFPDPVDRARNSRPAAELLRAFAVETGMVPRMAGHQQTGFA